MKAKTIPNDYQERIAYDLLSAKYTSALSQVTTILNAYSAASAQAAVLPIPLRKTQFDIYTSLFPLGHCHFPLNLFRGHKWNFVWSLSLIPAPILPFSA